MSMTFTLTEEQAQLQDAATRYVAGRYGFDAWRERARRQQGFDSSAWREMAEMGWMAVAIPEEYGGLGLGPRERAIVMETFGSGLVLEPYWSTAVVCAELLRLSGSHEQKATHLGSIASGAVRGALALLERDTSYDWASVDCTAQRAGDDWVLSGEKLAVLDAPVADRLMIVARSEDGGLSLFWVPAKLPGLTLMNYRTVDERSCSDLRLDQVRVSAQDLLGEPGQAAPSIATAIDHGIAALCAEATGTMASAVRATIEYLKTRKQFGRPLAEFQVLRHRVADMVMGLEQSRSIAALCTSSLEKPPETRARIAAAAKAQIGSAGRFIGESAVQMHGGIGVTDELQIGHFLKRLMAIDMLLGDTRHHLGRMAGGLA